ncbi:MAG: NAD-binding protein [Methylovulum sp.]|nr:NAD-binding protein [Methylovulum sp.]
MKHIAVFGYSIMSLEVMKRLQQSQDQLVFIGQDEAEAELMEKQGFITQVIDFRDDEQLKAIGIGSHIDILFCFYPTDSDNVFLTISARAIAKNLTIIAIVDDPESAEKLLAAGANKIIDPYEICGRKTHEMLTRPEISNILDNTVFGRHDLNLVQIEIPKGSCLEDTEISDLKLGEKHNLILIGVVDKELGDELYFAVGEKEHHLDAGDLLVVLGAASEIKAFKASIACP